MLPLNSPLWANLETYFGLPEEVPQSLRAWCRAIGTTDEEGEWCSLRNQFFCQHAIVDSAIGTVPHICPHLSRTTPALRPSYIIDLGQVHMAWRRHPIPSMPTDLIASYEAAVISIRSFACECLTLRMEPMEFRYTVSGCVPFATAQVWAAFYSASIV